MKYPSVRFLFDKKRKATNSTKGLLQIEITYQRQRKWVSTNVKLFASQWDNQKLIINHPDAA
ncbi:MAG: Arm DNA-binding domain-containing protein, partial [Alloprevotella sp.]|nr:Arm DNA-binding domain-containing protein [Alloprevotella sp.]